jgi:ribonuclease-3
MNPLQATLSIFRSLFGGRKAPHAAGPDLERLQKVLGHRFRDSAILLQSLTHKSAISPEKGTDWLSSNERLEFLGDAVLSCLITEYLYRAHPDKSEGQLSKVKSLVVSRKILGDVAYDMHLGRYLVLGPSESKTGGRERKSVLSNAFEAVLGALYLDGGLDVTRRFLDAHLFRRIEEFNNDVDNINYKSKLLEISQRDGLGTPRYAVIATRGPDHAREFHVRVDVAGMPLGEGTGTNKKLAQQQAAYNATLSYNRENILSHIKGAEQDELVSH